MSTASIFQLASQKADWLSARQATVSQNIANANTPGYRTKDVQPFEETLSATALSLSQTNAAHLQTPDKSFHTSIGEAAETTSDSSHSQNNVSLERELLKGGDVRTQFALASGIEKAFHRFTLAAAKS